MARPFRFHPPVPLHGVTPQRRLLDALDQRWERRLVTVVAGPGFGKSTLLASAVADGAPSAGGIDVWLSCEPADQVAEHLAAGLAEALGRSPTEGVASVLERVWSEAPRPVCLVLDDVHEIPHGSPGAALLQRVVTELPGNGHAVLASRDAVPLPTARLAAAGQLVRLVEDDLLLDHDELDAFAAARGMDPALLRSTGGWPALAELTASAGTDLVLDYLWEEVLTSLGDERAQLFARLALVGGGDDDVASALAGRPTSVDDLVHGVPLVARAGTGWAAPHPLWRPALGRLVPAADRAEIHRRAAIVHRDAGRLDHAADLFGEAEAWGDVLALLRQVGLRTHAWVTTRDLTRWCQLLPHQLRRAPEALLAAGMIQQAGEPLEAVATLQAAAQGFRERGDADGELAAISHEGMIRWWAGDVVELFALHQRITEIAEAGSRSATVLGAVGRAAVAHLMGDSAAVFSHLTGVDDAIAPEWLYSVHWLRSVAHRRNGDLRRAQQELVSAARYTPTLERDAQLEMAQLRVDWLDGRVDEVRARLPEVVAHYQDTDANRFLFEEAVLELAAKAAWVGEPAVATVLLGDLAGSTLLEMPGLRILRAIAEGAAAVAAGDEGRAAELLRAATDVTVAAPDRWYWRDRLAIALTHVLVPASRAAWAHDPMGLPHRPGVVLAEALEAAREGDLTVVATLTWPAEGAVRAHLPVVWIAELAAAGAAAGNPPPSALLEAIGAPLRPALRAAAAASRSSAIAAAGLALEATVPGSPPYHLRVEIIGPLSLRRDGDVVSHAGLRRQRVRQLLCHLVAFRKVRREAVAVELWPELDDGGHNLRVTLSYLQRVLQPERSGVEPPFFLRSEGQWLSLAEDGLLVADVWELDDHLDRAAVAERAGRPSEALEAYRRALPLWRGEPYADADALSWVLAERGRLTGRYVAAGVRAGELLLAAGERGEAQVAAERAIVAEPAAEPAHRLLARVHLDAGDRAAARRSLDRCAAALAELGVEPEPATLELREATVS